MLIVIVLAVTPRSELPSTAPVVLGPHGLGMVPNDELAVVTFGAAPADSRPNPPDPLAAWSVTREPHPDSTIDASRTHPPRPAHDRDRCAKPDEPPDPADRRFGGQIGDMVGTGSARCDGDREM